ncbi:MAG TPA: hypothetical protein VMT92_11485 [Steroidobacteraceae bacterium]|nr:hypothetical protein [Steroidobacteraceae bacterium]
MFPVALFTVLALGACADPHAPATHQPSIAWNPTAAPRLPLRIGPDLVIKRVEFGILESTADGDDHFVPATEVPAEDGQVFGWVVEVDTTRDSLHWQEYLRLPRPPADWGEAANDADVLISKDGKSAVAQGEDLVEDGQLTRFYWSLAAGDPAGDYQLDLAIEGRPVAHFTFRVPAPVQEKAILVHDGARRGRRWQPVSVYASSGAQAWR